jgi:glutathione S-transferase
LSAVTRPLLYYTPGAASLAPHAVLRELGLPHELVLVNQEASEQRREEYLRFNPHGRVPTLVHGDLVLYESAAICLYLADLAPGALAPPVGAPTRPLLYQWACFLTNTLQPALMTFHYPERVLAAPACQAALREHGERWSGELFERLDRELELRPYLLGERLSVCDLFLWMLGRWARTFARPPRELPHLGPYLGRLTERPSVRAALAGEGLPAPYI